jgi:hypothetical protein
MYKQILLAQLFGRFQTNFFFMFGKELSNESKANILHLTRGWKKFSLNHIPYGRKAYYEGQDLK